MTSLLSQAEYGHGDHFRHDDVGSLLWTGITVKARDRRSKERKTIVSNVNGMVREGELMAVMGPSGSGKSTLLHALSRRSHATTTSTEGLIYLNGAPIETQQLRRLSAYVEQEDALIGSLTVRETLSFAARLSSPPFSGYRCNERIDFLLAAFGLSELAESLIGMTTRKGVSDGQKRRVSVASQLVTEPKILFLDEPTSGLDSAAASEVIAFLKKLATKHRLIIIASIHQPATSTFMMFDRLLLLCQGYTAYNGPVDAVSNHFEKCGSPIPAFMKPAEFALDFVNTDFARDSDDVQDRLDRVTSDWYNSEQKRTIEEELSNELVHGNMGIEVRFDRAQHSRPLIVSTVFTLIHRSFLKSHRDIVVYGIRVAMYLGLALLMGTVWLRLKPTEANVPAFVSAIFFGGAFMPFMAVAYIPAFLEDFHTFRLENSNGLYGPAAFLIANFLTGIPFLFCITLAFSSLEYWLTNFRPTADGFFTWVMWLFLDLLAAESLVVLVASCVPVFVVALAGTALINGLWMCVGGSLRPMEGLNRFWRYIFHYIDYQTYVFQGMMRNEFGQRNYFCQASTDGHCECEYDTPLQAQCLVKGDVIPTSYGLSMSSTGTSIAVMVAIITSYRVLAWLALKMRRR